MDKKNVLVFPCGSEIGLEIYRSLRFSNHFNVFGGSSVEDHGKFVYENYIGGIPLIDDNHFIDNLNSIVHKYNIDIIYPTMDSVIYKLASNLSKIDCLIVSSPVATTEICLSKMKMYRFFNNKIDVPTIYGSINDVVTYPVFLKPDIGYGSRGTLIANNKEQVVCHLNEQPKCLILEYLPGEEYTIDCFSDSNRNLLFVGARARNRILNGIAVNTIGASEYVQSEMEIIAKKINELLILHGAWFFQVKCNEKGKFKLLEVAARLGGSSGLFRAKGINFALLSLWDLLGQQVKIIENKYIVEMDRALDIKYKINITFNKVYIDLDDALLIDNKINESLVPFLYKCINTNVSIVLITKHMGDLQGYLSTFRIDKLFDKIIHLRQDQEKSDFIDCDSSIFIDDSFAERQKVADICKIPVFDLHMIDALL